MKPSGLGFGGASVGNLRRAISRRLLSFAERWVDINDAMFELPSEKTSDKLIINRAYAEEKFNRSHYSKLKVA